MQIEIEVNDSQSKEAKTEETQVREPATNDVENKRLRDKLKKLVKGHEKKEKPIRKKKSEKVKKRPGHGTQPRASPVRPEKDKLFHIRRNRILRFLRVIMWVILIFLFIKGVYTTVRPDSYGEAMDAISDFRSEFSGYKELDSELLAFAENFVRAYLTYDTHDRDGREYCTMIEQYTTREIGEAALLGRMSTCIVNYSKAYRKTAYSPSQADIYVLASVTYYRSERNPDSSAVIEKTLSEVLTLKVPVAYQDNRYIVEDLPAFVADSNRLEDYEPVGLEARVVDEDTQKDVLDALVKFFKAYYEQDQGVIDYFLTSDADRAKFQGLGGMLTFIGVGDMSHVYDTDPMVAVVSAVVENSAGDKFTQNFNIIVVKREGNYYVRDINLRTQNINYYYKEE